MLQEKFDKWIRENKSTITKSEKYSKTIVTISNDFKKIGRDIDIYNVTNFEDALALKDDYFSYNDFYVKNTTGNRMYSRAFDLYIEFLQLNGNNDKFEEVLKDNSLTSLEKETIVLSRIGQGRFREDLIKLWGSCVISGFLDTQFLIASHIKSWKESNNLEKIDKFNGLLLLPTYDKLFDLGFISFEDNGKIKISSSLVDFDKLGINVDIRIDLREENKKYLEYHRANIFK